MTDKHTWDTIHKYALQADKEHNTKDFCKFIRKISNQITCSKCKNHMLKYIEIKKPENATSFFKWSWEFHNEVNIILNKPTVSYEQALTYYS